MLTRYRQNRRAIFRPINSDYYHPSNAQDQIRAELVHKETKAPAAVQHLDHLKAHRFGYERRVISAPPEATEWP